MGAIGEQFQEFLRDCAKNRRHCMRVSEDDMTRMIKAITQHISNGNHHHITGGVFKRCHSQVMAHRYFKAP